MTSTAVQPRCSPPLDPEFVPAILWNRAYQARMAGSPSAEPVTIQLHLARPGSTEHAGTLAIDASDAAFAETLQCVERQVKFLLWARGAPTVILEGANDTLIAALRERYQPDGARAFDWEFVGQKLFSQPLEILASRDGTDGRASAASPLGRHLDGCRIGFDLGGSDRKAAALIDGKVVFSEEIPWDPYFQSDPNYHFDGVRDSLRRASAHLPRVDAIGGSAAGIYLDSEVRAGSLYRGIHEADFDRHIRRLFHRVMEAEGWADLPWQVVNDGEVTALAASMSLETNAVLGISMGTSLAAGYVDPHGNITSWFNELAFAPIDYGDQAPADEWSGDIGCGVQYFSQQGVARLIPKAGIEVPKNMPFPEQLVVVQDLMTRGDERALRIYQTIGICFGYAIAHYHDFYDFEHLYILGRVTSGSGGQCILEEAKSVFQSEFPELAERTAMHTPSEHEKRHGQAMAAATLPALKPSPDSR